MATTPIYAGGARRGAAPAVARNPVVGATAINQDDELLSQLLSSFAQAAAPVNSGSPVSTTTYMPMLSEALGSGSNVIDFGSGLGGGEGVGPGTGVSGGVSPGTVGAVGQGLSAIGALGQNADIGALGGMTGMAAALSNAPSNDAALGVMGQALAGMMGVPGVGVVSNAISGNAPATIDGIVAVAVPGLGAFNALMGLVTGKTIGSLVAGDSGSSGSPGTSDVSNATGIAGIGFSDAAAGPPDSGPTGADGTSSDGGGVSGVGPDGIGF